VRIAALVPSVAAGSGGTERCAAALLRALAGRGHQVVLFTADAEGRDLAPAQVRLVPRVPRPSPAAYASFMASAAVLLKRSGRFDLVYSAGANTLAADAVTAHYSAARGRRLMRSGELALEGSALRRVARKSFFAMAESAERRLYRSGRLRRIIAVSARLREELIADYRLAPEKLVVIPNGVDAGEFSPEAAAARGRALREEAGARPGQVLALFLGGDWERKGLATLLEALAGVPAALRLAVVGQGDVAHWTQRAAELGVAGRVFFAGPTGEAAGWYAAADFLVLPTRYEPFGLPPLEAAACGRPALFSRLAGVSEILADGSAALHLENPLDAGELRVKMERLAADEKLRGDLAAGARQCALGWSWARVAEETERVLAAVLAEKEGEARS
jgi:UDP-glucose:(heptosyl)LPS alpha-1,3-glucosyltransferase